MKILVLCESIDINNGSVTSAMRFMLGLAKKHNIILYTTPITKEFENKLKNQIKNIKIRTYISNNALLTGSLKIAIFSNSLKKDIIEDCPDIIYNIHPTIIANKALKIAKKLKIPFVSHVHADDKQMKHALNLFMSFFTSVFTKFIFNIYNKSDYLIYPSELAREMNVNTITNKNYAIISNGIDLKNFYPLSKNKKFKLKTVFSVGRIEPSKNYVPLLDAFTNLPEYNLIVVGRGILREKYLTEYSQYKNIQFIERVSSDELVNLYQKSHLFVFPSIFELEGMVTLEAMACGLPILVSNHQENASRFFVKDNGFLFKYNSSKDLTNKIRLVLDDPKLLNIFSENSLKIVRKYSIDESIDKLEKLFKKIIIKKN
jgi:glycosyltransferase involved in cell wall biosynthesis